MQGITNATSVGKIKILNVVQTGTLTRDGAVFSGFSSRSYLQCGARVDNGILSLDSSTYIKNVAPILTNADNWEIMTKICLTDYTMPSAGYLIVYGQISTPRACPELAIRSSDVIFSVSADASTWLYGLRADYVFTLNKWYYLKTFFDGTKYGFEIYDEDMTLVSSVYQESTTKILVTQNISWGRDTDDNVSFGVNKIDMENTYIKANNETVWKGVETL